MPRTIRRRFCNGHNALLNWVLILALALLPVESLLAGIPKVCGQCHHTAAQSMVDVPDRDMHSLNGKSAKGDCCCCQGGCHSETCGKAGCGVTHTNVPILASTPPITDIGHTLQVAFYATIHKDIFARAHYRPPQS